MDRDPEKDEKYSHEQAKTDFGKEYENKLKSNKKAWQFFQTLTPSVKKQTIAWIMGAKKEETRLRRLDTLITSSEKGHKIPPLNISKKSD